MIIKGIILLHMFLTGTYRTINQIIRESAFVAMFLLAGVGKTIEYKFACSPDD